MSTTHTVVIMSDEHNRDVLGCYGDPIVRTPHLDALAMQGCLFRHAYANSPVCVPSRASCATGRHVHRIGAWDSTSPFDGSVAGWAARLLAAGHEVVSIGKLHFRSSEDPNGFTQEILPMHVFDGVGWATSLLRDPPAVIPGCGQLAGEIGPGESRYAAYDRAITKRACRWLADAAARDDGRPWTLYVGLVAPHFPLQAPRQFYDLYAAAEIPPPRQYPEAERPRHPVLDALRELSPYDAYFDPGKVAVARRAYYGLCSFLDHNVGCILRTLDKSGLSGRTRVIYTSDHGDNLGHRGLWGKSTMYEDSVAVPLIVRGPGISAGLIETAAVSLVDLHPTLTGFAGLPPHIDDQDLPGTSLATILAAPDRERAVFSEYHDWSSITGIFMLRKGRWKLVEYPGYAPQLFDLEADPREEHDLAALSAHGAALNALRAALAQIADVEAVNAAAFAAQARKIAALGGRDAILGRADQAYTPAPELAAADPREP